MNHKKIVIIGGSGFIGTNFIDYISGKNIEIFNLDITEPINKSQKSFWSFQDFLDPISLCRKFSEIKPDYVVDLAARTDVSENETVKSGYQLNIDGVKNIINAINTCGSVSRVVFTSTQYVKRPGGIAENDFDVDPHTVYGQSKVQMEKTIRASRVDADWSIIRPTNVWGPWHFRYKEQFFKVLKGGYYFHPDGKKTIKSYAYVGNVACQIYQILNLKESLISEKTFYVGDAPILLKDWVNAFSLAFTGRPVKCIPAQLLLAVAKCGDFVSAITGKQFLLTTSRYNSMIENYLTPMDQTFRVLGDPYYSMDEGVELTVKWLNSIEE